MPWLTCYIPLAILGVNVCWVRVNYYTPANKVCGGIIINKQRSYLQCQGNSAHIPKIGVRPITPYCHAGWYSTQYFIVSWLTQGHIAKFKVTVHKKQKFVSGPQPLTGNLDVDDASHNCYLWHRNCCCGGICPIRTCLVWCLQFCSHDKA